MKAEDFDLLCAALAFTAVAMTGDRMAGDGARRAAGLAYLIKEFCRASVPEAFAGLEGENPHGAFAAPGSAGRFEAVDRMAAAIAGIMRKRDDCVPQDLLAQGFTSEEIDRHWTMAKALAHVELNMLDS